MRTCTICIISKDNERFSVKKSYHDGLSPWCKDCTKIKNKAEYERQKEHRKQRSMEYYNKNKEKILTRRSNSEEVKVYNREYKRRYKIELSKYNSNYIKDNRESITLQRKEYRSENKDKINSYNKIKTATDPLFKLSKIMRKRIRDFLLNGNSYNKRSTAEYLGCSMEELKSHIEKQFKEGMTWENHGKVWHIDHVIPLAHAKTEDQLYDLAKWSNIQPLFIEDNLIKNKLLPVGIAWQKLRRDRLLLEDVKAGLPLDRKASEFKLAEEPLSSEHRKFIQRYEWLGTCGFGVRKVFTARHNGILGGVVMIAEPNSYQFDQKLEALIQRGACASWTPKNLGSRLVMFACKWMAANTDKRIFTAYSDPHAGEIGTIYQACNFDYLGEGFGSDLMYKLKDGREVGTRHFTRTSSMKKWAKELGIIWQKEWSTATGFQIRKNIPEDIKKQLDEYARGQYKDLKRIRKATKGKYVLLLTKGKEKLEKTWESKKYPKRKL